MVTFNQAQEIISTEFSKLNFDEQPHELYEPINYILSIGGKRIRPVLTLMACNLFTDDYSKALKPAIALEIFHNFTLLHDDIMDNAKTRRNNPTVHEKWNNNVAILSGDAMCIKAYQYVAQCDSIKMEKVLKMFNQTAIKVCEGQQYDMNFETCSKISSDEYLKMIELKTAVLLAACLNIGALAGGASETEAELLYNYGKNIGLAFQLQDDVLDVYANEKLLGKETGKDIVSNKKTFLLITALELAKGDDLIELNKWIEAKFFDPIKKVEAVKNIYNKLGIKEKANMKILACFNAADIFLSQVKSDDSRKDELKKFADSLKERVF